MEIIKHPLTFIIIMTLIFMLINKLSLRQFFQELFLVYSGNDIIENHKIMLVTIFNKASRRSEKMEKLAVANYDMKYEEWRKKKSKSFVDVHVNRQRYSFRKLQTMRNRFSEQSASVSSRSRLIHFRILKKFFLNTSFSSIKKSAIRIKSLFYVQSGLRLQL